MGTAPPVLQAADKLDLLFVIDNSESMGDYQDILRASLGDLLSRLVSPPCVDRETGVEVSTPSDPEAECDAGARRRFKPISDLHAGVLTTSLGLPGEPDCGMDDGNDYGHLLGSLPRGAGLTAEPAGFLRWRRGDDLGTFQRELSAYVAAVGHEGCGYEAGLEAWYRFLVDPQPYELIETEPCDVPGGICTRPTGVDRVVLEQRAAFLRPDSVVAIVMLTDENDCSLNPEGPGALATNLGVRPPRGSPACLDDPDDPCCYPCNQPAPPGCASDPGCVPQAESSVCERNRGDPCCYACEWGPPEGCTEDPLCLRSYLPGADPNAGHRCLEPKRYFGVDFLHPVERYTSGLSQLQIQGPQGTYGQNPLYPADPAGNLLGRDPSFVFLLGILGVPWQDVATEATREVPGQLELVSVEALDWGLVLEGPAGEPPRDALMIESVLPRVGESPFGGPLEPPESGVWANPINGHEWNAQLAHRGVLQHACIFELQEPHDCSGNNLCDCFDATYPQEHDEFDPVCQNPATGEYSQYQHFADAAPGRRYLEILRGVGPSAIVSSACPKNTTTRGYPDFGYRPALTRLLQLATPKLLREE